MITIEKIERGFEQIISLSKRTKISVSRGSLDTLAFYAVRGKASSCLVFSSLRRRRRWILKLFLCSTLFSKPFSISQLQSFKINNENVISKREPLTSMGGFNLLLWISSKLIWFVGVIASKTIEKTLIPSISELKSTAKLDAALNRWKFTLPTRDGANYKQTNSSTVKLALFSSAQRNYGVWVVGSARFRRNNRRDVGAFFEKSYKKRSFIFKVRHFRKGCIVWLKPEFWAFYVVSKNWCLRLPERLKVEKIHDDAGEKVLSRIHQMKLDHQVLRMMSRRRNKLFMMSIIFYRSRAKRVRES